MKKFSEREYCKLITVLNTKKKLVAELLDGESKNELSGFLLLGRKSEEFIERETRFSFSISIEGANVRLNLHLFSEENEDMITFPSLPTFFSLNKTIKSWK